MDQLKEQLKKHYEKTQPTEGFLQKLHTLEVPEPAPVPVRRHHKRLLAPIAAMLIAAVALLGGGKYLMDMVPLTEVPPEIAVESAVGSEEICYGADDAPTSTPEYSAAPDIPETYYAEDPAPEKTPPEPGSSEKSAPESSASPEPTEPEPSEDTPDPKPPIEVEGSADDPTPPPDDDVPPHDPGDDDPPTEPDINAPTDEPDDPVDPPVEPSDPPDEPSDPLDEPINPDSPPEITGRYAKENGQHIVYLTNCDTGEICTLNLTSSVKVYGYANLHTVFGCQVMIYLRAINSSRPSQSTTPSTSPMPDISEITFQLEVDVICAVT